MHMQFCDSWKGEVAFRRVTPCDSHILYVFLARVALKNNALFSTHFQAHFAIKQVHDVQEPCNIAR